MVVKMKWYTELKSMLDTVSESLARNANSSDSNRYSTHFHSHALSNTMELLRKTFSI